MKQNISCHPDTSLMSRPSGMASLRGKYVYVKIKYFFCLSPFQSAGRVDAVAIPTGPKVSYYRQNNVLLI